MKEQRSIAVPFVVAVLLLLPVLYVGSYLAMLDPLESRGGGMLVRSERYRGVGDVGIATHLFRPINLLDRRIRPSYWEEVDPSTPQEEPPAPSDDVVNGLP